MIRKFVVNGTEYDSPDAMPPDVRREYERALRLVADMGKGGPSGTTDKTVETRQDGVSVKVHTTYDDLAQLPPEVRARVEQALQQDGRLRDTRVVNVQSEFESSGRVPRLVWWLVIGALVAVVLLRLNT
jgi:hypothetical protein